jgi:outer membrane protein assembly factor BamB
MPQCRRKKRLFSAKSRFEPLRDFVFEFVSACEHDVDESRFCRVEIKLYAFVSSVLILFSGTLRAENWPQFRGPRGDGSSLEKGLPVRWSQTENIAWKTAIPGEGHSSPVVWEGTVLVTTALPQNGHRMLLRVDAQTGRVLWQVKIAERERESMHRENSSASSTPATDGKRIVTSFQIGDRVDVRCFDFEGKELWAAQPLQFAGEHGYSYSPIFYRNLVILDCRQEGEAATIALDKETGNITWSHQPRRRRISHITPLVINDSGREQLIVSGSDETCSLDPASGREYWRCDGPSDVAVAGLCYGDGMVFTTAGYPTRTRMAIRTNGKGDISGTGIVWKFAKQAAYVPSPVWHRGHLYSIMDEGLLYCFDGKTGGIRWDHRLGGRFRSSLMMADGNIYASNDKGLTTVFRANPTGFVLVATNDLKEFCYATPAVSNQHLYVRTGGQLYCIGPEFQL